MNLQKNGLPEGITQDQIDAWKKQYGEGKIKLLKLAVDDVQSDFFHVVAKVPDRPTLSHFEKWTEQNPDKAKSILVTNCLLSGKEQVQASDYLFFTAVKALSQLVPVGEAEIKNL